MFPKNFEPVSKQLTIVVGLTVVGFMTFGLALSFYRNILFENTLQAIAVQNGKMKQEIDQSQHDLEYYQSYQYKDKYAKENLDKIQAGEKLLVITDEPKQDAALASDEPTDDQKAKYEELLREIPVIQHWWLFLFHREKIEELKKGL